MPYVKLTDYAAKDALLTGDPIKRVKGTEIGADFDAVATWSGTAATKAGAETLTNKTIALGSNTLSGTLAQFNTAVTDANLAAAGANTDITSLTGTATNDDAAAGKIGEYIESVIAAGSAISLASSTAANVTSISLTAGDWDVSGDVLFTPGAATSHSLMRMSISLVSATIDVTAGRSAGLGGAAVVSGGTISSFATKPCRISIASTTTIYLVGISTFTTSTMTAHGMISARRAR